MNKHKPNQPFHLMGELRRRRVLYTAVVYGISAFAVTEIAAFLFENFGAPAWADRLLAALFVAGFPVAMFLSWAFDISTDGIVRASRHDRRKPYKTLAMALLLMVVATGGLFYMIFPEPQSPTMAGTDTPDFGFEPVEKLENSIAVLPFENLSSNPDDVFFSTGVAEEVLNHLGSYRELNIIGRTSSFVFRETEFAVPKISAMLGVRFLVQGSVQRYQDQVRVSTQLLNENGVQLWSQNFDRQLTDIFAIQSEIAGAVAEAVVPEVIAVVPIVQSTSPEAYDHYLKGRELLYQRNVQHAIEDLEHAVELDPEFAPAHTELAIALMIGGDPHRVARAKEAIDIALSLQPDLLRTQAALGLYLQTRRPPDFSASVTALRGVLAQDPSMTDALNWLQNPLRAQGHMKEADELLFRAVRLDPLHPALASNAIARAVDNGEDRRAITIARRMIENPDNRSSRPYIELFNLYGARGRLADAVRVARESTENAANSDKLDYYCYCMLSWSYSLLGDWDLVNYWQERSYHDFQDGQFPKYFKMLTLRWEGRIHDALNVAKLNAENEGYRQRFGDHGRLHIGILEALAGDHESAINRLAPLVDAGVIDDYFREDAIQALAWAYLNTGHPEQAKPMLQKLEEGYEKLRQLDTLRFKTKHLLNGYALNAVVRGEPEQALDRLEEIIGWGWRMINLYEHDPRWDPVRDSPRFQALVALVKVDVARQRAELEATAPHEDFIARLDAGMLEDDQNPE